MVLQKGRGATKKEKERRTRRFKCELGKEKGLKDNSSQVEARQKNRAIVANDQYLCSDIETVISSRNYARKKSKHQYWP